MTQTLSITEDQYTHLTFGTSNPGFCINCGMLDEHAGCEPDARRYNCPECETPGLFGLEECLIMGLVTFI